MPPNERTIEKSSEAERVTVTWRKRAGAFTTGYATEDGRWYVYQRDSDPKALWRVRFMDADLHRGDGKIAWWRTRGNAMHYAEMFILEDDCPHCEAKPGEHTPDCFVPSVKA
jgi:hypothetical protein